MARGKITILPFSGLNQPRGKVTPQPFAGPLPGAPGAPPAPQAPPAPGPVAPPVPVVPDYRDSTYNLTLSDLLKQRDTGEQLLDTQGRRAKEDLDVNVSRLGESKGKARTSTTQSANKQGLFYSGTLGKQLGDVESDFGRRTDDVNSAFQRGTEDRATARTGLEDQYGSAVQKALQDALARRDAIVANTPVAEDAAPVDLLALIKALGANLGGGNARSAA